jgi:hypothetical protein
MPRRTTPRAAYHHTLLSADPAVLVLFDRDEKGSRSVTNDVECVLAELKALLGEYFPPLCIYKDSQGIYDEIRHVDGASSTSCRSVNRTSKPPPASCAADIDGALHDRAPRRRRTPLRRSPS